MALDRFSLDGQDFRFFLKDSKTVFNGTVDAAAQMIDGTFTWGGEDHPLVLKRDHVADAVAARAKTKRTVRYEKPEQVDDGWHTAHLRDVGLQEAPLAEMVARIHKGKPGNVHSVLIVKNGKLVFETYFEGQLFGGYPARFDRQRRHNLCSASKSVVSAVMKVAIGRKQLSSVEEPVLTFVPEYADALEGRDDLKLEHLLSMTAGFEWDEHTYSYRDKRNTLIAAWRSGDRFKYLFNQKTVASPGERFTYTTVLSDLIGVVIARSTGKNLKEYADEALFTPLNIDDVSWGSYTSAGSSLALRPRDMAKIGSFYLNEGRWQDEQIVPESGVRNRARLSVQGDTRPGTLAAGSRELLGRSKTSSSRFA